MLSLPATSEPSVSDNVLEVVQVSPVNPLDREAVLLSDSLELSCDGNVSTGDDGAVWYDWLSAV